MLSEEEELEDTVKTNPLKDFTNRYTADYMKKCKELGLQDEYTIDSNGRAHTYTRKRLTTKKYVEVERARAIIEKEGSSLKNRLDKAEKEAELYLLIGQAYLTNKESGQPIQKEEFENMLWEDIKIVIDACHLRTLMGIPS